MKTAISLPDDLFEQAERLARRLSKSRSQLYAEALAEFVARHDPDVVTRAYDAVCEAIEAGPDPAVGAAGVRRLADIEW